MKVAALIFQALKPRPPQLKFLLIFEKNVKNDKSVSGQLRKAHHEELIDVSQL